MVTQLRGTSHSHCGPSCQVHLALQKKLWPLSHLIKPCSLLSALQVHGFLPLLPSWHLFCLSSSNIPFPWVNKMFVRCKEIKMHVHVINILIIIKIIVTREVIFFFQEREANQLNFSLRTSEYICCKQGWEFHGLYCDLHGRYTGSLYMGFDLEKGLYKIHTGLTKIIKMGPALTWLATCTKGNLPPVRNAEKENTMGRESSSVFKLRTQSLPGKQQEN